MSSEELSKTERRICMATIVALDVSKGKSFYVMYQEMTCLYEGEITHTKSGFQELDRKSVV